MSEKTIAVIKEVKEGPSGISQYGEWTRWDVLDGNDERYSAFSPSKKEVIDAAKLLIGKKVELEYENTEKGKNLVGVMPVQEEPQEPAKGTGEYIVGSKSEADRRGMASSTAANCAGPMAADVLKFQTGREISLDLYKSTWDSMYQHVFMQLLRSNGILRDEDIPF